MTPQELLTAATQIQTEVNALVAALAAEIPAPAPMPVPASVSVPPLFSALWTASFWNYGFFEQSKVPGRATMTAAFGRNAVRLHTEPGDNNVAGSNLSERDDLSTGTVYGEGMEQWWAHSILLPDDYDVPVRPTDADWNWTVLFDFHHTGSTGQANFMVVVENDLPGSAALVRLRGFGGVTVNDGAYGNDTGKYVAVIGPVVKNYWYDFIWHVRWSSGPDGFFDVWVNGARKLAFKGPTLYAGMGCYFKLANYHTATGNPSSVIHGPVLMGTSIESVGWRLGDAAWQTVMPA